MGLWLPGTVKVTQTHTHRHTHKTIWAMHSCFRRTNIKCSVPVGGLILAPYFHLLDLASSSLERPSEAGSLLPVSEVSWSPLRQNNSISQRLQKTLKCFWRPIRRRIRDALFPLGVHVILLGVPVRGVKNTHQYLSALGNFPDRTALHLVRTDNTLWDDHEPLLHLNIKNLRFREEEERLSKVTECAPAGSTTKT